MAVSRVKLSSITQGFPKSRSFLDGNSAYNPSSFESIATFTAAGGEASYNFTSIPSTYKHLQLRTSVRNTSTGSFLYGQFNGDTGANYSFHNLSGDGASASASGSNGNSILRIGRMPISTDLANVYGTSIVDILDYGSTSKNKTIRVLMGADFNGSGTVYLYSNAWFNTAAVSSILVYPAANTFAAGSTVALYGIKG